MHQSEIQSVKQRYGIIGNSPELNHAIQRAIQVAPTDMTVLITGESGSGKESFSKIIHSLSHRKHGQFIAINCGAIPEGTIDSELFGHEKGSFTGATDSRKGYFEVTTGGTIFLDEIGEMPLPTQSRLLRVLENGEFIRVGSSKVQTTDVRVVAATNVNLMEAVEKGEFREDLYYRLNTLPIYVPALRDRGDDVLLLFRKFASDFSEAYRVKPIELDPGAQELIKKYRFPGNIRELKNLVEQISLLEENRIISSEILATYLPDSTRNVPAIFRNENSQGLNERDLLYKVLFDMRKDMTELKKLVVSLLDDQQDGAKILQENQELFEDVKFRSTIPGFKENSEPPKPALTEKESPYIIHNNDNISDTELEEDDNVEYYEDIYHETEEEEENLSLENKEKELIIKALRKNNNKRKYAARDLGISERTLYRKIKQYEIEA
ncbi:sigma-54 interaction domain-containing protein [Marinigracilibium pacificum]|uniref:Sigma-54-dependent Fis family transcriptional regulator n=1 Tax=Marinigracilibium pacificum TaxID=2729599 RepID=A0A848J4B0_9BACT|nr:sigma-54 dependent transcriptional regulator [Marinigracilibium pacificum]NMM49314.1 sigma-54-dependent Fis family transcriptional regulator [Marinigracilibium pacificum]